MITGEEVLKGADGYPIYRLAYEAQSHVVKFKVYRIQSVFEGGEIAEEELCADCFVKWDGCSNWDYLTSEIMAHFCGVSDLHQFCSMQIAVYAKAATLLQEAGSTYPSENRDEFFLDRKEKPAESDDRAGPVAQDGDQPS